MIGSIKGLASQGLLYTASRRAFLVFQNLSCRAKSSASWARRTDPWQHIVLLIGWAQGNIGIRAPVRAASNTSRGS